MTQAIIDEVLKLHAPYYQRNLQGDLITIQCEECCNCCEAVQDHCRDYHLHDTNPNNRCKTVRIITKERE